MSLYIVKYTAPRPKSRWNGKSYESYDEYVVFYKEFSSLEDAKQSAKDLEHVKWITDVMVIIGEVLE